uniref:Uncharacterized protein MANES_02G141500 n=1 Tax=Rhizophora mucronata TaxID=61149 RepID=A0A2P2L6J3_RHIMU
MARSATPSRSNSSDPCHASTPSPVQAPSSKHAASPSDSSKPSKASTTAYGSWSPATRLAAATASTAICREASYGTDDATTSPTKCTSPASSKLKNKASLRLPVNCKTLHYFLVSTIASCGTFCFLSA